MVLKSLLLASLWKMAHPAYTPTLSRLLMGLSGGASATGLLSGHISVTCQILAASFTPGDRNKLQLQWLRLLPQREQPIGQEW